MHLDYNNMDEGNYDHANLRAKRELILNEDFYSEFPDSDGAYDLGIPPSKFEISVNMYLSPSFRNTRRDAKAILRHAAIMLDHPTLDSKFKLKPTIINFETTIELINRATLFQFQDSLPSIRLKKGTVHMLLLGGVDTSGPVTKGLAQANSICGGNNK